MIIGPIVVREYHPFVGCLAPIDLCSFVLQRESDFLALRVAPIVPEDNVVLVVATSRHARAEQQGEEEARERVPFDFSLFHNN